MRNGLRNNRKSQLLISVSDKIIPLPLRLNECLIPYAIRFSKTRPNIYWTYQYDTGFRQLMQA